MEWTVDDLTTRGAIPGRDGAVTKRDVLAGFGSCLGALTLATGSGLSVGLFGGSGPAHAQRLADAPKFELADMLQTGELADMAIGAAEAPVTIIEYASMTCGHCGNFHRTVHPELKSKYIDTGKVRFIFREFPLNNYSAAAAMLARCVAARSPDAFFPFLDVLFKQQDTWAFVPGDQRVDALFGYAKQAGMTREVFEGCLRDQKLLDDIKWIQNRARDTFGVDSTPTLFINGIKLLGGHSLQEIEEVMAPFLDS
ncbi:MAG: thioredoxin domain-containing protein [Rhizobiales bacterium]|nr:thioredoxin domain-containing protein [Hyphomicrobiales bacterium]